MPYLDSGTPAFAFSDWDTSRDAAIAIQPHAQTQRDRLEAWYRKVGSTGATDAECERALKMRRSSICARRNELLALGRVVKTDRRRSGCAVYVATEGK